MICLILPLCKNCPYSELFWSASRNSGTNKIYYVATSFSSEFMVCFFVFYVLFEWKSLLLKMKFHYPITQNCKVLLSFYGLFIAQLSLFFNFLSSLWHQQYLALIAVIILCNTNATRAIFLFFDTNFTA